MSAPRKVSTDFTLTPLPPNANCLIQGRDFCAVRKFGFSQFSSHISWLLSVLGRWSPLWFINEMMTVALARGLTQDWSSEHTTHSEHGGIFPRGVWTPSGLLIQEHLQLIQPTFTLSQAESSQAEALTVRQVWWFSLAGRAHLLFRYNSNVIRLSNNSLVDTRGLYQLALDLVECPEDIAWLDLSFNDIEEVTDDILE